MSGLTWEHVAAAEVFLMVPFVTAFPILYGLFWPWHTTPQGRAIFTKSVGMALLVDLAVLYRLFPDHLPPKAVVASFVYAVILAGQIGLVVALLLSWHHRRNEAP